MCPACIIHLPQPAFYIDQQKSLHHLSDRSLPTIGPQEQYLVLLRIKMSLADEEVNSNWGSQYLMIMRMLFRKVLTVASWQLTALELPLMFGRRWELACWQPVIVVYAVYAAKAHNSLVCFAFSNVLIKNALRFDVNVRPLPPSPPHSRKKTISSWRKSSSAL